MSRRIRQQYICRDLEELARQLLFVPADRRAEQVRRAEQLHDQLDARQNYPFDFLKFRITGHRPVDQEETTLLVGQAVLADLRLLIDTLSRSIHMPLLADEEVYTPEALARHWNVSTRTVTRWRQSGLRWRWAMLPQMEDARLVIPLDAAQAFAAAHPDKVQRAGSFTQMTPQQRQRLIHRARRLALARELSLNQVAGHLAQRVGRSLEAIRQLLLQHDQQHPQHAIFTDRTAPLSPRQQEVIARARRRGVRVRKLAEHFNRTHSTIYRAIRQRRAGELRKLEIHHVPSPTYQRDDAELVILRPVRISHQKREIVAPDLPEPILALYTQPGVSDSVHQRLLVQYNYLKCKAARLRDGLDRYEPRVSEMDQIDALLADIRRRRNQLVACSLFVVLSVAQRHLIGQPQTGPAALAQLLELGNPVLFDAIEQSDVQRSENFTSFVTYRLQRRFALVVLDTPRAHRRLDVTALLRSLQEQAADRGIGLGVAS